MPSDAQPGSPAGEGSAAPRSAPITLSVAHYLDEIDLDPTRRALTTYIVVDVIRATTTLAVMFERGVRRVYVARSVEAARRVRATLPGALVAGEVAAVAPPDFDHGNSPEEWGKLAASAVAGREVLFSSTNGARGLHAALGGGPVFAGALRNATAVCARALAAAQSLTGQPPTVSDAPPVIPPTPTRAAAPGATVLVVCSGRDDQPAEDDSLCAGWLIQRLQCLADEQGAPVTLGAGAQPALDLLAQARAAHKGAGDAASGAAGDAARDEGTSWLYRALVSTPPARDVLDVDLGADLAWCADVDASAAIPVVVDEDITRSLVVLERAPDA